MCLHDDDHSSSPLGQQTPQARSADERPQNARPGRRTFLRTAGLAGAGAAALGAVAAGPAAAAGAVNRPNRGREADAGWHPDQDSPRFTLAVMPDTQFLYWGTQGSINPEPQEESFRYIIANSGRGSAG